MNRAHHAAWPGLFASDAGPRHGESHWRRCVASTGHQTFVATLNERVVGFIALALGTEEHVLLQRVRFARINTVCVVPDVQGIGVGRAVMALAERWSVDQGATDLRLVVSAFNDGAVRLYEELGFAIRSHAMGKSLSVQGT